MLPADRSAALCSAALTFSHSNTDIGSDDGSLKPSIDPDVNLRSYGYEDPYGTYIQSGCRSSQLSFQLLWMYTTMNIVTTLLSFFYKLKYFMFNYFI